MKNKLSVLLGAGAAIEIGGPTSETLTQSILDESEFLKDLSKSLDIYYGEGNYNFEDLLHLLEILQSYKINPKADKAYKPIIGAFMSLNLEYDLKEVFYSKTIVYKKIWERIIQYNDISLQQNDWYRDFFEKIGKEVVDIFTLNYDLTIQNILKDRISDGFIEVQDDLHRISLKELYREDISKVINLHGSIALGYLSFTDNASANKYAFEDSFYELYKYTDIVRTKERFFQTAKSSFVSQSAETTEVTPLITGLRKTDKLLVSPFNVYHHYFFDAIRSNSNLLVIGYSFGDKHINSIINKITALHGDNRKVVVITYLSEEERKNWHPDYTIMMQNNKWLTPESLEFYSIISKDFEPFGRQFKYQDVITSNDGKVKIYFGGFKNTIKKYEKEILDFLK